MTSPTQEPAPDSAAAALPDGAVHGNDALRVAAAALLRLARREVRVSAPFLDPLIYNTTPLADALSAFATAHPRNRARLLVEDTQQVLRDNPRLIELVRRLSDLIELREVESTDRGRRDLFLIADRSACLLQEDAGESEGKAFRKADEIASLIGRFDDTWNRAVPMPARTLGL